MEIVLEKEKQITEERQILRLYQKRECHAKGHDPPPGPSSSGSEPKPPGSESGLCSVTKNASKRGKSDEKGAGA